MPRQPTGRPPGRPVGSGAVLEREQTRLTVRIPATLYDRLEAFSEGLHFTRGTPQLAGCVRDALEHFLVCPQIRQTQNVHTDHSASNRQTTTIHTAAMNNNRQTQTCHMSTSCDNGQTENSTALEVLPAEDVGEDNRQTQNGTANQPETVEQHSAENRQPGNVPAAGADYDHTRFQLGALCKRGHGYGDTGQSLREVRQGKVADCYECHKERARTSQARRLAQQGADQ